MTAWHKACIVEHMNTTEITQLSLSWAEAVTLSEELGHKIKAYCDEHKTSVDALVILPMGGLVPGDRVARVLGTDIVDVYFARVSAYRPNETALASEIKTGQLPTADQIAGKRIWVVDEVCDSGVTLKYILSLLESLGAAEVHTAVLHYKPTKSTTGVVPDIYMTEVDSEWINYPWESLLTIPASDDNTRDTMQA